MILVEPNSLRFTIPGQPIPKARARVTSRGTFTPPKTVAFEKRCGLHAMAACAAWRQMHGEQWPRTTERFAVRLVVVRTTGHNADLDNVAKSVLDGMQGPSGLWLDDAQVDELAVVRGVPERTKPRVEVTVTRMPIAAPTLTQVTLSERGR